MHNTLFFAWFRTTCHSLKNPPPPSLFFSKEKENNNTNDSNNNNNKTPLQTQKTYEGYEIPVLILLVSLKTSRKKPKKQKQKQNRKSRTEQQQKKAHSFTLKSIFQVHRQLEQSMLWNINASSTKLYPWLSCSENL